MSLLDRNNPAISQLEEAAKRLGLFTKRYLDGGLDTLDIGYDKDLMLPFIATREGKIIPPSVGVIYRSGGKSLRWVYTNDWEVSPNDLEGFQKEFFSHYIEVLKRIRLEEVCQTKHNLLEDLKS